MMKKYKVTYMGYAVQMLYCLKENPNFEIVNVVGVKGRISEEERNFIEENRLPYKELEDKSQIYEIEDFIQKSDAVIVYKFEYIIPESLIQKYRFYNFHGGNIRKNRGAHAVVWSILNLDRETCLTMYQLTGGIDVGIVIGEYNVQISDDETTLSLNEKLMQGIPKLLERLIAYMEGRCKGEEIQEGIYLRKIKESDYTINPDKDTIEVISAKIRSQKAYHGAVLFWEGRKYRVKDYTVTRLAVPCERKMTVTKDEMAIEEGRAKIEFNLSEAEQH